MSARVTEVSSRLGVTPFVTLLAGYNALLSRITGAEDIVVGTPIGNRDRGVLEPLIGYVAHALPLRTDLSGDPSFTDLVRRAQQTLLNGYAHPDLPYEEMVAEVRPDLDSGRNRIFDAMFVLHSGIPEAQSLPGMTWRLWQAPDMPAMFGATLASLSLMLGESSSGYTGALEYAEELFDTATARRVISQLTALLGDALARPEARISELRLGAPSEQPDLSQVTPAAAATAQPALSIWVSASGDHADQLAAVDDAGAVTRGELAAQAAWIADALRERAGAGTPVWLDLAPSPLRLAALLGAWLAGCPVALPGEADPDRLVGLARQPWRLTRGARTAGRGPDGRADGSADGRTIDLEQLTGPVAGPDAYATTRTSADPHPAAGAAPPEPSDDGGWRIWSRQDVERYLASLRHTL
ncbi:MAG: condensation domain-containing protein, partial [Micromonosporaceae bacterium]